MPRLRIEQYRIVDYFYLNPFDIHTFRTAGSTHRKLSTHYDNLRPYRRLSEPAAVAIQMWQFQQAGLAALARREFISASALATDVVSRIPDSKTPDDIRELVEADVSTKAEVLDFLQEMITRYPIGGQGGLKDRSGLLDFRYDMKSAHAA
jgi:hypothetical protein